MGRRKSKPAAFSLFAFQDIITSVTGIMILITLMLAIELMNRVSGDPQTQTQNHTKDVEQINDELREKIKQARGELDAQTDALSGLPAFDIETLLKMLKQAQAGRKEHEDEDERQRRMFQKRKAQFEKMQGDPNAKLTKEQLAELIKGNLVIGKKIEDLDSSNRMLFKSDVKDKTVWVVVSSEGKLRAAKIGVAMVPQSFSTPEEFTAWAKRQSAAKAAFYLIAKPGGELAFRKIRTALSRSQFAVGSAVVPKGQVVMDDKVGVGKP